MGHLSMIAGRDHEPQKRRAKEASAAPSQPRKAAPRSVDDLQKAIEELRGKIASQNARAVEAVERLTQLETQSAAEAVRRREEIAALQHEECVA
jgi:predicted  nucleic acid-binding Zn-ribbon protein